MSRNELTKGAASIMLGTYLWLMSGWVALLACITLEAAALIYLGRCVRSARPVTRALLGVVMSVAVLCGVDAILRLFLHLRITELVK